MNEHHEVNRRGWNVRTEAHFKHPDYRVKEFLEGQLTLHPLELKELGDVRGKTLLHLQCHFGLDTLSWARLGAKVIGVDISDRSIERAEELKVRVGLPEARFIRTDLCDLPSVLHEQFDVVFASYGAIWWMSDIKRWARTAARHVRPGGIFYMAEFHPVIEMLDAQKRIFEPYFHQAAGPEVSRDEPDYCDPACRVEESCGWRWTLGDVVTALIEAGLTLEFLHEFPFCVHQSWPSMIKEGDWWYYPDGKKDVPLTFSIKARK